MAYFPPTGSVVAFQGNPSVLQAVVLVTNLQGASVSGIVGASVFGTVTVGDGVDIIDIGSGFPGGDSAAVGNGLRVAGYNLVYNGANWDRQRGNSSVGAVVTTAASSVILAGTPNVNTAGSVVAFQGTTPWVVNSQNSSILAVPVGSVITVFQAPSIVGTYGEDAAHTTADKGIFTLGVRNDAVASFVSADLEYTPKAVDSAGRTIIKPFAADDSAVFRFQTSIVSGSVTLIKASAIGLRSYITDFWLVNSGSVATLVTWQDGSTSILGYAVAPAGTGANSPGINIPIRTNPSQDLVLKQAPSASILYVTVTGYQSP